ncbi:oligopeptide/dipeptide ABC transporter ATP-binding protein [Robertmurraya massiliosenegalensis]|uniref:ABC transporter ATP-binding protein n=1 Tax=Robertmurraya TaxID=2837507 RepID=UPI0039A53B94
MIQTATLLENQENKEEQYLLEIRDLKKYFDVSEGWFQKETTFLRAVDGINIKVKRGETLGIVGESGCGKSTTGNVIMGLLEATEGQILFEGKDIRKLNKKEMKEVKKDIQMIFQDPYSSLNPRMKVFDIIAEPFKTHKIASGKELEEKIMELLEVVGLDSSYAYRYPHEFSGGQRQRIGIARALALKPKLIICDEPVSALDVSIQSQVLNLLNDLQKKFNLTYIFIAHGLPAVKHISNRIAVMYLGKVVELASKDDLFTMPLHPYTEGLINAIPIPDPVGRDEKLQVILEGDLPSPVNPPSGCHFHTRCPYATKKCQTDYPDLVEKSAGHYVACHFSLTSGHGIIRS